tara:strand:+ start:7206 stop:7520 length:315 start_codon:yes stop_codon:yes gene_type:complete
MSYDKGVINDYRNQMFLLKKTISILFNFITLPIAIPMIIVRKIYLWRYRKAELHYKLYDDADWISQWIGDTITSLILIFGFMAYVIIPSDIDNIVIDYVRRLLL